MTAIASLLAAADDASARLDDALYALPDAAFAAAPDGGWSIRDILGHLAAWNEYFLAALAGRGGIESLGVTPEAAAAAGEDGLNSALVLRWSVLPLDEVWDRYAASRAALRAAIASLEPASLDAPFATIAPDSPFADDAPLSGWLLGVAAEHADDHIPRIMQVAAALSADATTAAKIAELDATAAAVAELGAHAAMQQPGEPARRDAGGWSAADHLAHLAAWNREL
ncbi:MAG: DinB family protein, partial [Chloroflexota bacterium]